MAKNLAKKQNSEMTFGEERPDYVGDGTRGQEGVDTSDLVIPRLDVLQALSPQLKANDPAFIEGSEQGLLFNSVTGRLYGDQVNIIFTNFRKEWVIWKSRKKGGGFRGAFSSEAEAKQALTELDDAEDCEIMDTAQHFAMIIDPASTADEPILDEIVVSMSRSKMKTSRKLNTMVKMGGGDRFSRVYRLSAVEDKNANNEDFWNISVAQLGFAPESIYRAAETMYEAIAAGQRDVSRGEPAASKNHDDEDM